MDFQTFLRVYIWQTFLSKVTSSSTFFISMCLLEIESMTMRCQHNALPCSKTTEKSFSNHIHFNGICVHFLQQAKNLSRQVAQATLVDQKWG